MFRLFKSKEERLAEEAARQKQIQEQENAQRLKREAEKKQKEKLKETYEAARREYGYTKGHNGIVTLKSKKWYAFISDNHLKLFICQPQNWDIDMSKTPNWQKQAIHLDNINYFSREGQKYTETKISGGGTKSCNMVDVAIAGAIAGSTGALIAARPQNESIKSEIIRHDERRTILVYNKGRLEFAPEDYDVFMKLIPDKEFSVVQTQRANKNADNRSKTENSLDALRKLKAMLDEGLITQNEYDAKKTDILKRM